MRSEKEKGFMGFVSGATYRFTNKHYPNHALNVYGINAASTGRNICLFPNTPSDIMQIWVVKATGGDRFRLHSAVASSYVLDCSDGSLANSYRNNAHLCAATRTSLTDSQVEFVKVSADVYKIYLPGKDLFLTATNTTLVGGMVGGNPAATIPTITALLGGTGGHSNVYWEEDNASAKQEWKVSLSMEGGGAGSTQCVWPTTSRSVSRYNTSGHDGADISPVTHQVAGDPIYAFMEGHVAMTGTPASNPKEGYTVRIHHTNPLNNGYTHIRSQYMHLQSAPLVSAYHKVHAGQLIGYMGNTGNVIPTPTPKAPGAGTHLHFEVRGGNGTQFPLGGPSSGGFATGTVLQSKNYLDICN